MGNVYFSNIRSKIIDLLKQSVSEVKVAMAWFTSSELFDELLVCLSRGVKVEVVLLDDEINYHPYAPDFNELIRQGGVLRIFPVVNGFLHHKFCIIDQRVVVTGSYNWTYYAENRNLENIILSFDNDVIAAYANEFRRLQEMNPAADTSKRISWDCIGQNGSVDFDILNYEITCISRIHHLPQHKVFKSDTRIEMVEKRFNPQSACHIGIQGDNDEMHVIVEKGTALPYASSISFWNNPDKRKCVECRVVYGDADKASENYLLLERDLKDLVSDNHPEPLEIVIHVTLLPSGLLNIEIRCVETGKGIDMTVTDKNLIHYE